MINKKLLKPIQNKGATKPDTSAKAHDTLLNRDKAEQHPISAITDLQTTLDAKQAKLTAIDAKLVINTNNITKNADDILLKADKTELVNKQDKLTAGTNITIVGDTISSSGGTTNGVTLDTDQTITGKKTFTEDITINGSDGKKYFFNTNARGGLIFSAPNYIINKVGVKNIIGFYEDNFISCFNNRITEVGTPTADYDAATKKYVDDAVAAALRPYLIDLEKRYGKGK